MNRIHLRKTIAQYAQTLHSKGFVANHDGNISQRIEDNTFLATPTAQSKRFVESEHIILVDGSGRTIHGTGRIFSEWSLHQAVYRSRTDIQTVIHAHPPYSCAYGLSGQHFQTNFMPELVVSLGTTIPCIPYALSRSDEQNAAIESAVQGESDILLIQGNGVLSVATNLEDAYLRIELLEHALHIHSLSTQMQSHFSIPDQDIEKLLLSRHKAGLGLGRKP